MLAAVSTTSVVTAPATVPGGYPAPATVATAVDAYPAPAPGAGTPLPTIPPSQLGTPAPPATSAPAPTLAPVQVGPLLREVWPKPATGTLQTAYLIYSELVTPADTSQPKQTVFWQVDVRNLTQRQKLLNIPSNNLDASFGSLSPDGAYIAYLIATSDHTADLHIVQRDGDDDRLIAQGLAPTVDRGLHRFIWSPDSSRLAFIKYWEQGQEFYVYDLRTDMAPRRIAQVGGADLIGWRDTTQVLVSLVTDPQKPLQLTSINTETDTQEALAVLPRRGSVFTLMSPDNTNILMSDYNFNLETRQFTKLDVLHGQTIWGVNSRTLLEFPDNGDTLAQLIRTDRPSTPITITLMPSYTRSSSFKVESASSDGMYLVVCESRQETSRRFTLRTLLYDVVNNSWQTLTEGVRCANVLSWMPRQ